MISLKFLSKNSLRNQFKVCKYLSAKISSQNVSDDNNKSGENVLSFNDFKSLAVNKKIEYKTKIILNEYEMYRNSDEDRDRVPTRLTISQMRQLLDIHKIKRKRRIWIDLSGGQRKHLLYLMKKDEESGGHNQLIAPITSTDIEKLYVNRLKCSALFGQNIVFDLSFEQFMDGSESKNLVEQIYRIYRFNKYSYLKYCSDELPFCLNLCNVDKESRTFKYFEFLVPDLISDKSFVNITSKSYLDVFPKQDLVYLSPHAEQVMTEYDDSAVFIIGGIVDRRKVITLSQPKAIEQNIRSVRLPIDSLTNKTNIQSLDSVFRVLFDFKAFGVNNENICFENRIRRHIPDFKLKTVEQTNYEKIKYQEFSQFSDDFDEEFIKNFGSKCD